MINEDNHNLMQLLSDIEKYFDCLLSEEEEQDLIRRVARCTSRDPRVMEAKAVMGFRTLAPAVETPPLSAALQRRKPTSFLLGGRIAAAVAMIAVLGCLLRFAIPAPPSSECIAFVKGDTVTEEEKVMELMLQNLSEFNRGASEAEQEILDELSFLPPLSE